MPSSGMWLSDSVLCAFHTHQQFHLSLVSKIWTGGQLWKNGFPLWHITDYVSAEMSSPPLPACEKHPCISTPCPYTFSHLGGYILVICFFLKQGLTL